MQLSVRGTSWLESLPETEYLAAAVGALSDSWHATDNPNGVVQLAVAENVHTWAELGPSMRAQVAGRGFAPFVPYYGDFRGDPRFRAAVLAFMRRHVLLVDGRPLADETCSWSPDHLLVTNGCGSALELLVFGLCDPGDAILTPAPIYPGFLLDVGGRAAARLLTVPMDHGSGYRLDMARLDRALAELSEAGTTVRALLLSHPYNPVGICYSAVEVRAAMAWCADRGLHLISDEIYAASVFDPAVRFTSAMAFLPELPQMTGSLHLLYGLSKDFGLSGLRVGVIHSLNQDLLRALEPVAYFSGCSSLAQDLATGLLEDQDKVAAYLEQNRATLRRVYGVVAQGAARHGIPHVAADSGFFVWLDLRRWLEEPTAAAEQRLWRTLLDQARVLLTPGAACLAPDPGMFRLCFAAAPVPAIAEGIRRIGEHLGG